MGVWVDFVFFVEGERVGAVSAADAYSNFHFNFHFHLHLHFESKSNLEPKFNPTRNLKSNLKPNNNPTPATTNKLTYTLPSFYPIDNAFRRRRRGSG